MPNNWGNSNMWYGPQGMPFPSAQYWNQYMMPSERLGYQGMLEQQGVYWPDFREQMKRLWPRWRMPNYPRWSPSWW